MTYIPKCGRRRRVWKNTFWTSLWGGVNCQIRRGGEIIFFFRDVTWFWSREKLKEKNNLWIFIFQITLKKYFWRRRLELLARVNMRENRSLCQVTKSEKHAWNTIRIVIFQHLKSLLVVGDPKFLWRWLGEIWQSHGTFSIGLAWFRFTEDNSTKESVDFARGSTLVPYPGLDPRVLIKSFLGVKIDVVYPMTQEECKGHTRSARIELSSRAERHLRQELICEEFQPSPPPSSDVTNFFKFWWSGQAWSSLHLARNFTLKFGGSSCVCYGCEMSRGGPLSPCPICHSLSALHLPPKS